MELCSADELLKNILDASVPRTDSKVELKLEFKYYNNEYGDIRSFIELKISEKRCYNIKNMKAFLKAVERGEAFQLGKNFLYNPSIHCFNEQETKVLDILKEINTAEDKNIYKFSSYGGSSTLIAGKRVAMPDKLFIRFLKLVKGRPIDVVIKGQEYKNVYVLEEDMPLDFKLWTDEGSIELSYDRDIPVALDNELKAFFYSESIYLPSQRQLGLFKPLYKSTNKENNFLRFSSNDTRKVECCLQSISKNIVVAAKPCKDDQISRI